MITISTVIEFESAEDRFDTAHESVQMCIDMLEDLAYYTSDMNEYNMYNRMIDTLVKTEIA